MGRSLISVLFLMGGAFWGIKSSAHISYSCSRGDQVQSSQVIQEAELEKICKGIESSINWHTGFELEIPPLIEVHLSSPEEWDVEIEQKNNFVGLVTGPGKNIWLQPFSLAREVETDLFSEKLDLQSYLSYVVHEVSHVVTLYNYQMRFPGVTMPVEQSEFIAYTAQMSLLPSSIAEKVLSRFQDKRWQPFNDEQEVSQVYHQMNPFGFAVKSYIYAQTDEGEIYMRNILEGRVPKNSGYLD